MSESSSSLDPPRSENRQSLMTQLSAVGCCSVEVVVAVAVAAAATSTATHCLLPGCCLPRLLLSMPWLHPYLRLGEIFIPRLFEPLRPQGHERRLSLGWLQGWRAEGGFLNARPRHK